MFITVRIYKVYKSYTYKIFIDTIYICDSYIEILYTLYRSIYIGTHKVLGFSFLLHVLSLPTSVGTGSRLD